MHMQREDQTDPARQKARRSSPSIFFGGSKKPSVEKKIAGALSSMSSSLAPRAENTIYWWIIAVLCVCMVIAWFLFWMLTACCRRIRLTLPLTRKIDLTNPTPAVMANPRRVIRQSMAPVSRTRDVLPTTIPPPKSSQGRSTAGTSGMSRSEFIKRP